MKWLLLFLIASCGGGESRRRILPQREEAPSTITSFSTRLNNNLLVAGERCTGVEVVTTEEGTRVCENDEYLVTVDDVNQCTPEGCTEIFVEPIIATLRTTGGDELTDFFEIVPFLADTETSDTLSLLLLRTRENEVPRVVFR